MTRLTAAAAALCAALATGCGGGGSESDDRAYACFVRSEGPALIIAAATDANTGAAIPVITLSNVTVGGITVQPQAPVLESINIRVVGGALECTTACGFSPFEGATTFTASAPGYASKVINTTSAYTTFTGTCEVHASNGTRVSITLAPL